MPDKMAMDQIFNVLNVDEWDSETIELVAEIVNMTGRDLGPNLVFEVTFVPHEDGPERSGRITGEDR